MFIYNWSPSYIRYFITADFPLGFIYFIFTSWTTRSTYFYFRGLVHSMSLRSGTGSVRKDKRIIIWVVAPLGTQTSPPTNWSDRLVHRLHRRPVGWTIWCSLPLRHSLHCRSDCSSLRLHRQLCWGLASYAGDSSTLGFFIQESPAELGTPLVFGFCYVSSLCFQVAPCCSD